MSTTSYGQPRKRRQATTPDRQVNRYKHGTPPETLDDHIFYGMSLDDEQKQFRDAIWSKDKLIVFSDSRQGTGKTTIAVATANMLVQYGRYDGITYIVSPCMENDIGFLPGSKEDKVAPYMVALEQALIECGEQPEKVIIQVEPENEKNGAYVDFIPHTFLRGVNLKNRVVILDESQNFGPSLKKVLTRCHDTQKVIVIGHNGQRDIHHSGESSFAKYINHFKDDPRTAVCPLTKNYRGWIANHADSLME